MFTIGPALTYTPDLFGHTRRLVEQQSALAESQARQLAAAYLTLTADPVTKAARIASPLPRTKPLVDITPAAGPNLGRVATPFPAASVPPPDVRTAEAQ